jgi:[ribosomal protein S5]-alanine N-acetyltransferase
VDDRREFGRAVRLTAGVLQLTPVEAADLEALHALWTGPGVRRFLWDGESIPVDRTREAIETSARLFAGSGFGLWAIRDAHARLVGFAGFWHFREPPELELLYGLAEDAWGRGYATEAARAVVAYGHDTLQMPVIRASTDRANVASVRVLARLGFCETRRETVGGLDTLFFEHWREDE